MQRREKGNPASAIEQKPEQGNSSAKQRSKISRKLSIREGGEKRLATRNIFRITQNGNDNTTDMFFFIAQREKKRNGAAKGGRGEHPE